MKQPCPASELFTVAPGVYMGENPCGACPSCNGWPVGGISTSVQMDVGVTAYGFTPWPVAIPGPLTLEGYNNNISGWHAPFPRICYTGTTLVGTWSGPSGGTRTIVKTAANNNSFGITSGVFGPTPSVVVQTPPVGTAPDVYWASEIVSDVNSYCATLSRSGCAFLGNLGPACDCTIWDTYCAHGTHLQNLSVVITDSSITYTVDTWVCVCIDCPNGSAPYPPGLSFYENHYIGTLKVTLTGTGLIYYSDSVAESNSLVDAAPIYVPAPTVTGCPAHCSTSLNYHANVEMVRLSDGNIYDLNTVYDMYAVSTGHVVNGGSGHALNDILYVGASIGIASIKVTSIGSGGAVTAYQIVSNAIWISQSTASFGDVVINLMQVGYPNIPSNYSHNTSVAQTMYSAGSGSSPFSTVLLAQNGEYLIDTLLGSLFMSSSSQWLHYNCYAVAPATCSDAGTAVQTYNVTYDLNASHTDLNVKAVVGLNFNPNTFTIFNYSDLPISGVAGY